MSPSTRSTVLAAFVFGSVFGAAAAWLFLRPSALPHPVSAASSDLPAPRSPHPALSAWLSQTSPYSERADTLRALLLDLPTASFPRLLDPLAARSTREDRRLFQIAFDLFVERDPQAAARWSVALHAASGLDVPALARQALSAWARLDPDAATRWACALPDEKLSRKIAGVALAALAERDPARALAIATSASDAFRAEVVPELFDALARTDPGSALRNYGPLLWKQGRGFYQLRA